MNEEEYEELARWLPCHPGRWVAWPEPFGTRAAALMAFVCARLGFGVPWLPSGLHVVSASGGLVAAFSLAAAAHGASPPSTMSGRRTGCGR